MSDLKDAVLEMVQISKSIVNNNLVDSRLVATEENQKYYEKVTPLISKFEQRFDRTPQKVLEEFLKNYLKKNNMTEYYETDSFQYFGRSLHSYCWAAITLKDPTIKILKTTKYPQLYVLANSKGIQFGFCYGANVEPDSEFVVAVKTNPEIGKRILKLLSDTTKMAVHSAVDGENGPIPANIISLKGIDDLKNNWSKNAIIESYSDLNIPDSLENDVTAAYDSMFDFFDMLSRGAKPEDNAEEEHVDLQVSYDQLHKEGRIEFITFHPSYSYEEFIEGITVRTDQKNGEDQGKISYIRKWGIFKKMCTVALASAIGEDLDKKAEPWRDQWRDMFEKYVGKIQGKPREEVSNTVWKNAKDFVLIIDEINRGDVSKIFGELVTLLENDKRLAQESEIIVELPYSNDRFGVPPNLHIIGTMNTADRSIALVDIALRRRFGFVEVPPDFEILQSDHIEKNKVTLQQNDVYQHLVRSIDAIRKINDNVIRDLGRDKQIGHSFFFKVFDQRALMMVWQYEILPLLEEYYYCDYDKILQTLELKEDNPYVNKKKGIKGFEKIEELNDFLDQVLKVAGSPNG